MNIADTDLDRIRDLYEHGLRWVLAHQKGTLIIALATLVATILLYIIVPKGLLPQQDTGVIVAVTEAAQSASIPRMQQLQTQLAETALNVRRTPTLGEALTQRALLSLAITVRRRGS